MLGLHMKSPLIKITLAGLLLLVGTTLHGVAKTDRDMDTRFAGIAERYQPEQLVGRRIVVVANLQPAKLMGVESRGMLLAASIDGAPYLLSADDEVPPGTRVK